MKYSDLIPGDSLYYKNIPEFGSWVQRVIMDMDYSHCSLCAGRLKTFSEIPPIIPLEFEADIKVRLHHFDSDAEINPQFREVYRLIDVPDYIINEVILELIEEFDGEIYAFLQWLSIFIRRCGEWIGFENAKAWKIFWGWTKTVVCSELLYYFVEKLSLRMLNLFSSFRDLGRYSKYDKEKENKWRNLLADLYQYNPDTFTPKDLGIIQNRFNMIWRRMV